MDKPTKWEDYLYLVEFAYSNNYQSSIKMSHFLGAIWKKMKHTNWMGQSSRLHNNRAWYVKGARKNVE